MTRLEMVQYVRDLAEHYEAKLTDDDEREANALKGLEVFRALLRSPIEDDTVKRVPILIGFDQRKPCGELLILKGALPPTPNFVFSIGAFIPADGRAYELFCVSLIDDEGFGEYLRTKAALDQPYATPSERQGQGS